MQLDRYLVVDIETSSFCPIKHGGWAYSQHETTIVYCVCFRFHDGSETHWLPGDDLDDRVREHVESRGVLVAHNCAFEKAIWRNILVPRHGFPPEVSRQWEDTQALGMAINLPASLDGLAKALGVPSQKDADGAKLMKRMAKPNVLDDGSLEYDTDPANLARLLEYCYADVAATDACFKALPPLSAAEKIVWRVDQIINERGIFVDQPFAKACADIARERKRQLDQVAADVTNGELVGATSTPALKLYLTEQLIELPTTTKKRKSTGEPWTPVTLDRAAVTAMLERDDLPAKAREILAARVEATRATSLAKLDRVPTMVNRDGRLRGALRYCGAHTGRWTSHGLQVHNLPKDRLGPEGLLVREAIRHESLELLALVHPHPLEAISSCLRSVIAAPDDREIIAADFSAIEARVVAWLAGQDDITARFAAGEDVYTYAAQQVGSDNRQLGKVCTLALGYGMGDVKFVSTATGWGVPLLPKEARRIRVAWREANDRIVSFWYALQDAAHAAVEQRGAVIDVGRIRVTCDDARLRIILPSGRALTYWRPSLGSARRKIQVVDEDGSIVEKVVDMVELRFFGPEARGMKQQTTYGGKLAENVTQAVARDLLACALVKLEARDPYDPIVHVHDSVAAEVPRGKGDVDEFCSIITELPSWAVGLPMAAEGYRGRFFHG
jgi:DNA polymerase